MGAGVVLIALGLVKKVAIADYLARTVVDPVSACREAYSAPDVALAAYAYAAQIYCDFSGYTDIAIGVALLMGFVFPQNFNSPYRATSFRDFWRRWHMTLSRFLRDFVYIPLGGNRGGPLRTARNLMITMVLGGLWHGAAWGFVLWGALHGVGLVGERALRGRVDAPAWLRWAVVFNVVVLGWVLFRTQSLASRGTFLRGWRTPVPPLSGRRRSSPWSLRDRSPAPARPIRSSACACGWRACPPRWAPGSRVVAVVGATVPSQGVPPFIYFQF